MEFKKINEDKFQCLLYEEDLEYNNITLDDFFRNDTEKIHNLLEVIMDEAHKNIGVELGGGVMSLQLAPQPDHSILLTVSSGKEDFGNMLKQAGERAAKALGDRSKSESNVIKNGGEDIKAPEFAAFDKLKDIFDQMKDIPEAEKFIKEAKKAKDNKPKVSDVVTVGYGVYILDSFEDFEDMCMVCPKVWGVANGIYKKDNRYYLVLEKGRCARERYNSICNVISEYARLDSEKEQRVIWVKENCEAVIKANAISKVKKYL